MVLDLEYRLSVTDKKFDDLKAQHQEQLTIINTAETKAKEIWDEMMRVQGDYRTLSELLADSTADKNVTKANKKATTVEAVAGEK